MNYQKVYDNLIESRKKEVRDKSKNYYESHHIIPLCLGGCKKCIENIVILTPREHFIAHWLLSRIYPDNEKIQYAFWCMCVAQNKYQERKVYSSIAYEEARQAYIKQHTIRKKGSVGYWKNKKRPDRIGKNHPMYGKGYLQAGDKNAMYGKPAPNRKKIKIIGEDIVFNSVTESANYYNVSCATICAWAKKNKKIEYA